jgi:hypothetical protein
MWQVQLERELVSRLPQTAFHHVAGSARDHAQLDQWSDLDLDLDASGIDKPIDLLADTEVWAASEDLADDRQVLRVVFADGRRVDLVVEGGRVRMPALAADNDVRILAALAAAKMGRNDRLIGLHLTLELMRLCLVQAMLLRDRDLGTSIHRFGSTHDAMADEVAALLGCPLEVSPRPNIVEQAVELYGRWRRQLEPAYSPDWSGLHALLDRGLEGG